MRWVRKMALPVLFMYLAGLVVWALCSEYMPMDAADRELVKSWGWICFKWWLVWLGIPCLLMQLWIQSNIDDNREAIHDIAYRRRKIAMVGRKDCMENWRTCGHCKAMHDGSVTYPVCDKLGPRLSDSMCPNAPLEFED